MFAPLNTCATRGNVFLTVSEVLSNTASRTDHMTLAGIFFCHEMARNISILWGIIREKLEKAELPDTAPRRDAHSLQGYKGCVAWA